MVEIVILDKAQEDLDDIAVYWAHFSEKTAKVHLQNIMSKIRQLQTFPRSGKVYEELNYPNVREILAGPYRIFYHIVSASKIHILTIHHSALPFDWENLKPN